MPPLPQDPFYMIRQELQEGVNDLQQKMSRFHGLTSTNPDRRSIAQSVESGCDSVRWQLAELEKAVDKATENPQKFNLTPEELSSRRRWIQNARRQVDDMKATLKNVSPLSPALTSAQNKFVAANDEFIGSQKQKQQEIMRQHDNEVGDLEIAVKRIGEIGKKIGEEMDVQDNMLNELDQDVDTTHTRMKATSKRVSDLLRKTSSNTQFIIMGVLIVILVILVIFVIY